LGEPPLQNKAEKSIVWNGIVSKVEKPSKKDKSMPIPDGWAIWISGLAPTPKPFVGKSVHQPK